MDLDTESTVGTLVADGRPSGACVSADPRAVACYAALCQGASRVPIVEPDILMDGLGASSATRSQRHDVHDD
jgi:fructose-bisphosphate aldolase class I